MKNIKIVIEDGKTGKCATVLFDDVEFADSELVRHNLNWLLQQIKDTAADK